MDVEQEKKEKKPRAPKPPAPPAPVEKLVAHALKLAATKPKAKWLGASAATLFSTKEANHEAALAECTKPDAPLLKQVGKGGALTPAGFERIANVLPEAEVVALTKATAAGMTAVEQVAFLQGAIGRTPNAAAELTPLLDQAVAAKKVELEANAAAEAKRAAAAEANRAALKRALELSERDKQNEIDSLLRQWEALGQKRSDLPAHKPAPEPANTLQTKPAATGTAPEPRTGEERDFRRNVADQLAASWRAAWDAKKDEPRDYLESAMWNVGGLKLVGETGTRLAFDGRYHECKSPVSSGESVRVTRPGWVLEEDERDYVVLKTVVEPT